MQSYGGGLQRQLIADARYAVTKAAQNGVTAITTAFRMADGQRVAGDGRYIVAAGYLAVEVQVLTGKIAMLEAALDYERTKKRGIFGLIKSKLTRSE